MEYPVIVVLIACFVFLFPDSQCEINEPLTKTMPKFSEVNKRSQPFEKDQRSCYS